MGVKGRHLCGNARALSCLAASMPCSSVPWLSLWAIASIFCCALLTVIIATIAPDNSLRPSCRPPQGSLAIHCRSLPHTDNPFLPTCRLSTSAPLVEPVPCYLCSSLFPSRPLQRTPSMPPRKSCASLKNVPGLKNVSMWAGIFNTVVQKPP